MIAINQKAYLELTASRFRISEANPIHTPMEPGAVLSKDQCPKDLINVPYHEACGHVLWPAVISRPDIQFAVGILSQFMQNPAVAHWKALKRVMIYLYATRNLWLVMGGNGAVSAYTDADWAGQSHRHSVSGYVFLIGIGAVTWSSKKQDLITLSTTEAEYIAGTHATKEAVWLRNFLAEIRNLLKGPTVLRIDNRSAISLAKDNKFHARTKHIDIRYHYIRECVEAGLITPHQVPTEDNVANVFTKALPRPKFEFFRHLLGVRST
jgi:hypothetical protein